MNLPNIGQVQEHRPQNKFAGSFKWQKRHIIVDHLSRSIYLQVLADIKGELRFTEFQAINAGNWAQFMPQGITKGDQEVRNNIKALVSSGYTVKPIFFSGAENDDHVLFMLTDIREPKLTQLSSI